MLDANKLCRAMDNIHYNPKKVQTPGEMSYAGLKQEGEVRTISIRQWSHSAKAQLLPSWATGRFHFCTLSCMLYCCRPLSQSVFPLPVITAVRSAMYHAPSVQMRRIDYGSFHQVSAVVILRGGSCFEVGLKRVIPDCQTGRVLIQTNYRSGEPELHYLKLPLDIATHGGVLLLDPQMSSGGAALMAVRVLVDHGVSPDRIVFVTYFAGRMGLNRLLMVYPKVKVVVCKVVEDFEERWIERRYFRC